MCCVLLYRSRVYMYVLLGSLVCKHRATSLHHFYNIQLQGMLLYIIIALICSYKPALLLASYNEYS